MVSSRHRRRRSPTASLGFIPPQLATLVKQAPDDPAWLHEIKLDGYRMATRLDDGDVCLLTRTGLDWTTKYPTIAEALTELPARSAYLDGELCGVLPDGRTAFNLIQNAADTRSGSLVFFLFYLLFLDSEDLRGLPLIERKERLETLLADASPCLQFTDHQIGHGPAFHRLACEHGLVRPGPQSPSWGPPTGTARCKPLQFPRELRSLAHQRCACVGNALVGEGKCPRWLRQHVQIAGDRDWVRACGSGARGTRLASGRFSTLAAPVVAAGIVTLHRCSPRAAAGMRRRGLTQNVRCSLPLPTGAANRY